MPKMNLIPWLSSAIQLGAQREIGVPPQGDLTRIGTNELDGPIDPRHTAFMTDDIARSVNQIKHFAAVG